MAQVVLSDIAPDAEVQPANLFQGLRFFISQKVPQRSRFVNDVRFNGGEVLPIEKHADIKIVDHARKESLPGTYSYRYIENSVRNGILEDLKDHRVGPAEGTVRSIGSTIQPPKGTRNKYTQDDDHILWNWVQEKPQKGGGTDGNEIYKQLEAKHPQHPWQSWRDRWIKHLKGKPPPFPLPYNAPPTPPSDVPVAHNAPSAAEQSEQLPKPAPRLKSPGIPDDLQENESLAVQKVSPIDQNSKRKQLFAEEEIPSSSPPGMAPSPKRRRPNGSEPIREVASTPDMTPVRSGKKPESPIYIGSENDEGDKSDFDDEIQVYESPLGKQASDTLSEPGRTTNNAQAVFRDAFEGVDFDELLPDDDWDDRDQFLREPTQQVDLEVPPPDNGWDDEDSGAEASSESESTATEIYDPRPVIQETQAILRGPTPAVDLDVPDPEGGWDHVIPSSPPPMPSSPHAVDDDISDVDAQSEAWINSQVARGISVDHVITVWKATSMDTGLAEDVLEFVRKSGEMPKDKRGVWTETDDEDLGATDARKIQRLESKHGRDLLTARWEFLNFYKSA